ncbi:MAG: tetratricopeptide repeat protein [Bacteroidia bacterium]
MKKILLLFVCFGIFTVQNKLFSQAKIKINVDSLTNLLNQYPKEDTTKVKMLITLSKALTRVDIEKGIAYSEKAIAIAENLNAPKLTADALLSKAWHLESKSKYEEIITLTDKCLKIYEPLSCIKEITDIHNLLGTVYSRKQDAENGVKHFELAIALCEQMGSLKEKGRTLGNLSIVYSKLLNDPQKAIHCSEQALEIAQKCKDRTGESYALGSLSALSTQTGDYTKAIEYTHKALSINEFMKNNYAIIYNYQALGGIYLRLDEFDKALDYFNKILSTPQKATNKEMEATTYINIGLCYQKMKRYEEAITNTQKGIDIYKSINNTAKANASLLSLGSIYHLSGRKVLAHSYYEEALSSSRKLKDELSVATALNNIALLYAKEPDSLIEKLGLALSERYLRAKSLATEALALSTKLGALDSKKDALKNLSTIYEQNKDYQQAYDTYKEYIMLNDSLKGDDIKKQITRKEIQYEFDKKETELKFQQQLTAGELEKQKLLTLQQEQALTLNRQTLTLKEQALTLSNKEKDLARLAFLKEQAEKQEKEQELTLSEERERAKELDLKLKNSELSTQSIALSAKQKQNQYLTSFAALQQKQKFYLIGLAVLLLAGLGALSYFYGTLKKQKNIITQQNELNEHTIAILSHDIKEPLLGVKLLLKKLNKEDPFVAQASQSLENQINSVNGILNNLLKMKRLALNKNAKNVSANANEAVQNVLQELRVAIQTKDLIIQNDLKDNVTLPIAPEKLQIILHNLLSNAIKYSFSHQTIRIFGEGKGICIQDFGVGLSPEQRSKLMREVTASQKGTNQERGNGLGLFLVGAMLQGEQIRVVFDTPDVGGTIVKVLNG